MNRKSSPGDRKRGDKQGSRPRRPGVVHLEHPRQPVCQLYLINLFLLPLGAIPTPLPLLPTRLSHLLFQVLAQDICLIQEGHTAFSPTGERAEDSGRAPHPLCTAPPIHHPSVLSIFGASAPRWPCLSCTVCGWLVTTRTAEKGKAPGASADVAAAPTPRAALIPPQTLLGD